VSHPADVLKLENKWKLNTPLHKKEGSTKIKGDSKEVKDLAKFEDKRCFFVNDAGDGVVMLVHHGAPTTDNSKNSRCELREKTDGWPGGKGTHTLTVEGEVTRITTKKKTVVLAQVHGKDDDMTVFRLVGDKLHITDGNHSDAFIVDGKFPLGTRYKLKIEVRGGVTSYWVNEKKQDFTLKNKDPKNYFKAGNYLQSPFDNGESDEKLAEVVLYSVSVSHSDED
jgi:Alginate lyase